MKTTDRRLRWGILGAGRIAGTFAKGLKESQLGTLVAIASRTQEKADAFAEAHGAARAYGSYAEALADPQIDAIYLATPHPEHVRLGIAVLEAGKHLLCEKPVCLNYGEALTLATTARRHGRVLAEAFMYRTHPQTRRLVELVKEGAIGQLRQIHATFAFNTAFNPEGRLWVNALGGGAILDVGCYPLSLARLLAGAASGKPFANPVDLSAHGILNAQTGVDEQAVATLKFDNGIIASLNTGITFSADNTAHIYGSEGRLEIPQPWALEDYGKADHSIRLHRPGKEVEVIHIRNDRSTYALEADAFARAVFEGRAETDFMSIADTLGNMQALDKWREAIGLTYEAEKPANLGKLTFAGRPLANTGAAGAARAETPAITKAAINGVAQPASRLVMGCDHQTNLAFGAAIWDAFFEAGGNVFDTAWVYASGKSEALLGHWMRARAVRKDCVLIAKGAHTPLCDPISLLRQLDQSLERLQTDHAEIYLMHRDNPQVPVGEFVDALNHAKDAGKIGIFGGSNWTLSRLLEANAYARKKGLQGFSVVSNNFSLAHMLDPIWSGCESANTEAWLQELNRGELTLLPWSSQGRGFFTDFAGPDKRDNPELVRCWYSDANFERRKRAYALAAETGLEPINIALAYVLSQPFPTFPLVGPRTIDEIDSCARALSLKLSPAQLAWLNLQTDEQPS